MQQTPNGHDAHAAHAAPVRNAQATDSTARAGAPAIRADEVFDAIVVGSGISGGWAAKELTQKGLRTLVLERGGPTVHGESYTTEHKAPWELDFRGRGDRKTWARENAIQSQAGPFGEATAHWYINDRQNPYSQPSGKFLWIRGDHVGGRSITWGRQSYRHSELDFTANAREGVEVDWPIRYADIAPWYSHAERFAGISGEKLGLSYLPDGEFLPPMEQNVVEKHVRAGIERNFPGRTMTIGRTAVLTQAHQGRAACHYCGPCDRGCSTGSYFSSVASTLPAAEATGRMTLRPNSVVHSLIYDETTDRVTGVRVIDRETKEPIEFRGKLVFLCASTLGTTQILLNTKTPRFPNGLANSSDTLGHYIMDHHFKVGAIADIEGFDDRYYSGNRPNGIYVPRFRNLDAATKMPDFLRGYGYQGGAWREGWGRGGGGAGFGADFKNDLRSPGAWKMFLNAFGEVLPQRSNYADLDPTLVDEWGIPALRIHAALGPNEEAMRLDMATAAVEMLEAVGGKNVSSFSDSYALGEGIHEMGTARMGRDPRTSVLNSFNQAHDVPNLFITDGSCMTSASCVNPSLTYMALTARAVDHAVNAMKRGDLRV